jgi:hypothetical protein
MSISENKMKTGNRRRIMIVMMIVQSNLSYAGLVGVTTTCWEKSLCAKFLWEKQGGVNAEDYGPLSPCHYLKYYIFGLQSAWTDGAFNVLGGSLCNRPCLCARIQIFQHSAVFPHIFIYFQPRKSKRRLDI